MRVTKKSLEETNQYLSREIDILHKRLELVEYENKILKSLHNNRMEASVVEGFRTCNTLSDALAHVISDLKRRT